MEERLTVRIGANLSDFERKMSQMQSKMDSVGKSMSSVGKGMTAGLTLPVAGAVAMSIKSFADLEQAVGGVETLFKDSADAVIKNSESAYKRAGVSGVDYMENVTSFSATLLQGLEGDTVAAAKAADMAMVDMSDNANKFGTDIGSVQDAYQGFAKDNYTMLDNLKLGYGGTAGEMARLINESGVLGDAMEVTAETVNDVPFHTMVEAIHEVQTEMDITGTTMKEAEETVSGSFGMMKASFQDLAAGFGQEGADIENLFSNLWSSVGSFTDNITRVLGDMWDNLPIAGWQKWLGLIVVAMGPVLLALGTFISVAANVVTVMVPVLASIAKAGGLLKWLAPLFGALTSPITLTIAAIVALGAGFVLAYNKSETFRNFIDGLKDKFVIAWQSAMEFKDKVVTAFEGIIAIFKGDHIGAAEMLSSIGLSEETIDNIFLAVAKIQIAFEDVKDKIGIALGAVKEFFIGAFNDIKSWWDSDGALIFSAMQTVVENVFDGIKIAVDFALTFVKDLFERFAPIVEGIWSVLWPSIQYLVETVWEKIKLVIGVAMDLIQGIISSVAAIIEGDWSAFGEALKTMTLSIKDRVTEFFGNMKDNALRLFNELFSGATQWFQDMWLNVTTKVGQIKTDVVNRFNELKNGVIQKVTEAYNSITKWFSNLWTSMTNKATDIKNSVTNAFTTLKDNAIQRVTNMYNSITTWFSNLWTNITNKARDIKNGVTNRFTEMKDNAIRGVQTLYDRTSGLFDKVKTYASNTFDNMVKGAKELPGKIGSAIKNMAHKAVEGITSLGRSMGSKMESVVNGVIGGLNKVLKAIGVKEIGTISISTGGGTVTGVASAVRRFSTGTRNGAIANDMLGMVNDRGPGNGRGGATQELIQRDGQMFAPRGKNAIVPLKKGDRIFNGAETQSLMSSGVIPRFSQGTGSEGGNSGQKKGLFGTLKDVVSDVWSYISNPGKAFEAIISSVSSNFDGFDGFAGKMLSGGFKMVTDGIKNFIAKIFKENEGALGSGKGGKWMNYRMTTPYSPNAPVPGYPRSFNNGHHYGIDYGTPIGTPITATTGGRLSSFWNEGGGKIAKLVTGQLRQFFMHMQTVAPNGSVKAGDVIGKSGNSGRWTTGPHVHWQAQQGTDALNRNTIDPRKVIGHANGGIFSNQHIANFAEEGPEAIIPLSAKRRGRANSLYDSVGKAIGRDNDDKETINLLTEQNALLRKIYNKRTDIHMDGEKVGGILDEINAVNSSVQVF